MTKPKKTVTSEAPQTPAEEPTAITADAPTEAQEIDLEVLISAINETGDKFLSEVSAYADACVQAGSSPRTITFDDHRIRFGGNEFYSLERK